MNKKIKAIQTNRKDLEELLKVITNEGELLGNSDDCWEDYIGFVINIEDILSEQVVKEKLAAHFKVESIQYYLINDDNTVILVFESQEI
jgi:hypothetical protein